MDANGRQDEPLSRGLCALAARPAGLLGRGRGRDRLDREAEDGVRSERRRLRPLVSRRRLQHLLQRGRPPRRGRPRHAGRDHLRLAGHRHQADHHLRRAADQDRDRSPASSKRTSASAKATASSSTCRWCRRRWSRCWPARASARCIRWCSAASRRRSSPPASTTPSPRSSCRRAAASRSARVIAYKPLLDEAIDLAKHKPDACLILQRPQVQGRADRPAATTTGRRPGTRRWCGRRTCSSRCRCKATDPLYILYTSGTTGIPKGVVRDNGGHMVALKWSMKNLYGVEPGEMLVGGLRHRLGGRPQLHRLRAAAARLHHDPLRGQAGRHARRRRVLARHRRARLRRHVHRADRVPRHQEGGPAGQAVRAIRSVEIPHAVPGRRARRSRHHRVGGEPAEEAGDRSLVADRDRLGDRRQSGRPRPASGQARLADGADAGLRPARGRRRLQRGAARHDGLDRGQAAAAAVLPADAVAGRTTACARATSRNSPATTRPPTPATSTTTATST